MLKYRMTIGLLLLVALPLFFFSSFARDLWLPDEPRYAEVAMEMAESGNWLIPHLHGELYSEKPPFFFWLLAGSAKLFGGWNTFSMIFPAAVSALGCLVVLYLFAGLLFNRHVALFSSLMLMTSALFVGMGQMVRMDIFLLLCISLSLLCFYRLWSRTGAYDWIYALIFFVAAGLGTLTKGPIGIGLPGLIILIFLIWQRDFSVLKNRHLLIFWGILLYLMIVMAWFVPAIYRQGWEYAYLITIRQNFGRVYDSFSHARPWYFYLHTFPWVTLPWFPFFVSAALKKRGSSPTAPERPALTFLWIWWSTTFLFFSLVSGKLEIYLLPLFPPTAIITAYFWHTVLTLRKTSDKMFQYLAVPAYILAASLLIVSIALILQGEIHTHWIGILLLEAMGGLLIFAALKQYPRVLFGVVWSIIPLTLLYGGLTVVPVVNRQLTIQPVMQELAGFRHAESSLALWEVYYPIHYYVPFHIPVLKTDEEKQNFFSSPSPVYCLAREKYLEDIRQELKRPIYVLGTYRIQHKNFILISQVSVKELS